MDSIATIALMSIMFTCSMSRITTLTRGSHRPGLKAFCAVPKTGPLMS